MLTVTLSLLGLREGERVLDAGCGEGRHTLEVSKYNCSIIGLDTDRTSLKKTKYVLALMEQKGEIKGSWHLLQGDITRLPFKAASFDRIICSEVLEHVPEDEGGIKEMIRVLKGGGVMAISVPTYITEAIYWRISPDYYNHPGGHIRKYRKRQIMERLRRHGVHIYAIQRKHAFHSIYWFLRCLFGLKKEKALIPSLYHKFLIWDVTTKPRFCRLIEEGLNLLFPKSVVIYCLKGEHSTTMTSAKEGKGRATLSKSHRMAKERG
jgi:ubiquinone/menaquinone biosynthesis C-methylase UbiE